MRLWPLLTLALTLTVFSCSDDDEPAKSCTPGAQVECTCDGGKKGGQVCNTSGTAYGACSCGTVGASGAGGSDGCKAKGEACYASGTCCDNLTCSGPTGAAVCKL